MARSRQLPNGELDSKNGIEFLDVLGIAALALSSNFLITDLNNSAQMLLVISDTSWLGKSLSELCDNFSIKLPFSNDLSSKSNNTSESYIAIQIDGQIKLLSWSISYIEKSKEKSDYFIVAIKELNSTEHALLESFMAVLPGNAYWKDKDGRYLAYNKETLGFFGLSSSEDLIGKTDYQLLEKSAADDIRAVDIQVLEKNKLIIAEEISPGSPDRYFLSQKVPVRDKDGIAIGLIGVSFDITEKKQMEKNLQQAKERAELAEKKLNQFLQNMNQEITGEEINQNGSPEQYAINMRNYLEGIINCTPGHVYWKDRKGRYLGGNDGTVKFFGLSSKKQLIGKTDHDLIDKKTADSYRKIDLEVMAKNESIMLEEFRYGNPDMDLLSYKVPLHNNNDEVIGVLGITFDITEKKQMEKELKEAEIHKETQSERIKGMKILAASIAHEMRNILIVIHGKCRHDAAISQLIQTYKIAKRENLSIPNIDQVEIDSLQEDTKSIVRKVNSGNKIIDLLLNNILALEENIQASHHLSMVDCVSLAIKGYPFQKGQSQLVKFDSRKDFEFSGSATLVEHILSNLLKNALWHISSGKGARIFIRLDTKKDSNTLYFKDTGDGIPDNELPHIFDSFFSRRVDGTGVGLAFCKWAMENMGGKIECQSQEGEFTEFILTFPKLENS